MDVILTEKIRNLGGLGETVKVKPGYARNFLIPQGKGMQATEANLAQFEARRAELEKVEAEKTSAAQAQSEKLANISLVIKAKAGEGGKLFGSIGTRDIADKLNEAGVNISKNQVRMPHGVIRQIGESELMIHLHTDIDAAIKVTVVDENAS